MIEFIHTSKSFGKHVVHKDINLKIPKGKITFIIGPSGTGKSVFMKQAIGLMKPDSGQIFVDGEDIVHMDDSDLLRVRKKCGLLFQNAALFDSMNVYQNVSFPLREHTDYNESEIAELVNMRLTQVGLKDVEEKQPSELSGGMRKRVGLARAIILNPKILLYDEPTTGLDPIMTDVVNDLIVEMQHQHKEQDMTSVVISHDIKCTLETADNIIMIYGGYVVAQGTPEEYKKTDNPMVRQFFAGSRIGPIKS